MPIGNYSYPGDGDQRPFAITEPGDSRDRSSGAINQRENDGDSLAISAKEPDRQSTTRRGAQSGRSRGGVAEVEEEQPRSRSSQRSAGNRRGTQARRGQERTPTARRTGGGETKKAGAKKSRRGFAAMSPEQQREIARKGGLTVSRNRRHMADIGRIGGEHSHGGRRSRR
jgi:general stress protein YciG